MFSDERLARIIHEAGKIPSQEQYRRYGVTYEYPPWEQLAEQAKQDRIAMARFIINYPNVEEIICPQRSTRPVIHP